MASEVTFFKHHGVLNEATLKDGCDTALLLFLLSCDLLHQLLKLRPLLNDSNVNRDFPFEIMCARVKHTVIYSDKDGDSRLLSFHLSL